MSCLVQVEEVERPKDKKPRNNAAICHSIQDDDDDDKLKSISNAEKFSEATCPKKRKSRKPSNEVDDTYDHMTDVSTPPGQRLFDAIEKHCEYDQFFDMIYFYELEVFTFKNLVMKKSIKFANYRVMLWLK